MIFTTAHARRYLVKIFLTRVCDNSIGI